MEEKIKNIVARYTKQTLDQITEHTAIDRTAIGSSIMLHRMYGTLANEGIVVADYQDIKDYGTLIKRINGNGSQELKLSLTSASAVYEQLDRAEGVGIDMEKIAAMPSVTDFREDEFYKMNFAPTEIAYCILQANPLASFAGLFAAKEALIKADNSYKGYPFHSIIIDHLPSGKPVYKNFELSISHTEDSAIAIAIAGFNHPSAYPIAGDYSPNAPKRSQSLKWVVAFAFVFSIVALILSLYVLSLVILG